MYNRENLPKGFPYRLGYACLNTILRKQSPSIFCSRTARVSTISQNGISLLQDLGRQNVLDLHKMILWNEEHNIKFMRMSSDMFPFASHELYGYSLDYCKTELEEVGKLAKSLNHRLTMHPGQTNNLGSPSQKVVDGTKRDLAYHASMFDLMGLPADSVMIIHGGGVYNDKKSTLERWKAEFSNLPENVKNRLVLENDEICYSAEELLPLCEELDIPLVFDWHHDAINPSKTNRIELLQRIERIWKKRGIRQKMHYSESRTGVLETASVSKRRPHSDYVIDISMCGSEIDLMIEAKMKEQAVVSIYKKYNI